MIKKRKKKKKSKSKRRALLREAEEEEEVSFIRKSGRSRKGKSSVSEITFSRKRKATIDLPDQPAQKKRKTDHVLPGNGGRSKYMNKREDEMKNDFFVIKDAKERRMRNKYGTEDFVDSEYDSKLRARDLIPNKTFNPSKKYYDDNVNDNSWEFSRMKSALGRRKIGFMTDLVPPPPPTKDDDEDEDEEEEEENPEDMEPRSIHEMLKSLDVKSGKYTERLSFLNEQLEQVNTETQKIETTISRYKEDKNYLSTQYQYFQALRKWIFQVTSVLDHFQPIIFQLRKNLFHLQRDHFLNNFFESGHQNFTYKRGIENIYQEAKRIQNQLNSKFSLHDVKIKFEEWKRRYPHSYFDAHIGLCVRRIFSVYVTLELLSSEWCPFTNPTYFDFHFWKELLNYGQNFGEEEEERSKKSDDPDLDLLMKLFTKCVTPFIRNVIQYLYNPSSERNSNEMQNVMLEVGVILGDTDDFRVTLKELIIERFEYIIRNFDIFYNNRQQQQQQQQNQNHNNGSSNEEKLEIFMRILRNALSWSQLDVVKSGAIPIDRFKNVIVSNLIKRKIFPLISRVSKEKFGNIVAQKNFGSRKLDEVLRMYDFPMTWKQSLNSMAVNNGLK